MLFVNLFVCFVYALFDFECFLFYFKECISLNHLYS